MAFRMTMGNDECYHCGSYNLASYYCRISKRLGNAEVRRYCSPHFLHYWLLQKAYPSTNIRYHFWRM